MSTQETPALLLDDHPALAPLALAIEQGWGTLPISVRVVANLNAHTVQEYPAALACLPLAEYADLQTTHTIVPDLAAGDQHDAGTLLVADRRLDEVDQVIVDLGATSRTSELLTRATLLKFYGITAVAWTRDEPLPEETQQVIAIRDGGEALYLRDTAANRILSDLGRAWFILSGLPPVSHLLLAPNNALTAPWLTETRAAIPDLLAVVASRRRELRRTLAERYGVSRELLHQYYSGQFLTLTGDAQKSILALFPEGAWEMNLPTVSRLNLAPWAKRA